MFSPVSELGKISEIFVPSRGSAAGEAYAKSKHNCVPEKRLKPGVALALLRPNTRLFCAGRRANQLSAAHSERGYRTAPCDT